MVFSSLIFLFLFLPLVLLFYHFIADNKRNLFLVIVSLIFYAWGAKQYIWLLLLCVVVNYFLALLIGKSKKKKISKYILISAVIYNVGILGIYKYLNFITENISSLLMNFHITPLSVSTIALPIGISFYTFHALSYLLDVYHKKVKPQKSIIDLALYLVFFPQIIAGPIIRYLNFSPQLFKRKISLEGMSYGIKRFITGLSKKVIIANGIGYTVDRIFNLPIADLNTPLAWFGILCYSLQIYYDFSGYIDMAIGLGYLFGFRLPENFNFPYMAKSIQDFWRRWNITLSNWFRDYLYIPLGGSRRGELITFRNLLIVFTLVGVWHGASWNFLVWGVYNAILLIVERAGFQKIIYSLWSPIKHIYALLAIGIGWVIFRADTLDYAFSYIKTLFVYSGEKQALLTVDMLATKEVLTLILIGTLFSFPVISFIKTNLNKIGFPLSFIFLPKKQFLSMSIEVFMLILIFIYSIMLLADGTYNPFIYFRF